MIGRGGDLRDGLVEAGHRELRRHDRDRHDVRQGAPRLGLEPGLHHRQSPGKHGQREKHPRHPGPHDPGRRIERLRAGRRGGHFRRAVAPAIPRLPDPHERRQAGKAHKPADDIDQRRADEVRHARLHQRKRRPADEDRRPDADEPLPAGHGHHHPGRDDEREEGELPACHRRDCLLLEACNLRQGDDRGSQGTERDWRRVGDERQTRRLEGGKAGAGEERR